MRNFVVGTAGHIDHGKSTLIQALTGTDPDRLKEEKERGITIDLGFAHAPLSADVVASFIDVPGHERFVRNMLAGAFGLDAVMLVVAANEGVMPQTREHFHICRLLGIERGIIVLSKVDAADETMRAIAEADVRDLVRGSFLEKAPIVAVSARAGQGLASLAAALLDLANETRARAQSGVLRLPIDRVFTLKGFGTVVTGTLGGGRVAAGEELSVLPGDLRVRVRGLQVHGEVADQAVAGERTAMNLAGVEVTDLARGNVLVRAGTLTATRVAHVALELLEGHALKHGARVRVHAGSAEVLGRVRFAEAEIPKGGRTVAEIRFESKVALARSDRVVLRRYSPPVTIGGARILDPAPRPRQRREMSALVSIAAEGDVEAVARFLKEGGVVGLDLGVLASRLGETTGEAARLIREGGSAISVAGEAGPFIDTSVVADLERRAMEALEEGHRKDPLAKGTSKEELRRRVFAKAAPLVFDTVLERLVTSERVTDSSDLVAKRSHRVQLSGTAGIARVAIEQALARAGLECVPLSSLHVLVQQDRIACENAVRVLVQEKLAERIGAGLLVSRAALERFRADARARFISGSRLDVAEVKELTGLSRKYVIPLLEWLDRERVTRRVGAERIVL